MITVPHVRELVPHQVLLPSSDEGQRTVPTLSAQLSLRLQVLQLPDMDRIFPPREILLDRICPLCSVTSHVENAARYLSCGRGG